VRLDGRTLLTLILVACAIVATIALTNIAGWWT
jgi:hypothetical protein